MQLVDTAVFEKLASLTVRFRHSCRPSGYSYDSRIPAVYSGSNSVLVPQEESRSLSIWYCTRSLIDGVREVVDPFTFIIAKIYFLTVDMYNSERGPDHIVTHRKRCTAHWPYEIVPTAASVCTANRTIPGGIR